MHIHENKQELLSCIKISLAVDIALTYGGIDGCHHKQWVIDQILRALTQERYEEIIKEFCTGEDGPNTYYWDTGIAP